MFVKREILTVPIPKTSSKKDKSIRAEVHTIGKLPTLFITFYIRKKPITTVYVQGNKWLNYIHNNESFNTRKLFYNCYGPDGIRTYDNYDIPDEDLNIMSAFLQAENTVCSCLDVIKECQSKKSSEEFRARFQNHIKKSAEAKDFFSKLPVPPLSREEMIQSDFRGNRLYWWTESDDTACMNEIVMGHCTKCGETSGIDGSKQCPYCGNFYTTKLSSKRDFTDAGDIAKMYRYEDSVYCVVYRVERTTSFVKKGRYLKEGFIPTTSYYSYPRDVYMFSKGKMFQLSAWECCSIPGNKHYNGGTEWYFKDKTVWPWGADILPFDEKMLYGTEFKHSHLDDFRLFASQRDDHSPAVTILRYLKLYQQYPVIENLVTNGFSGWVYTMATSGKGKGAFNFNAKSLKDITGLNKDERVRARRERWTIYELEIYKQYRDKKHKILPVKILTAIADMDLNKVKNLTDDILSLALYLVKQESSPQFWLDYISMAAKLNYDTKDDSVKYPYNLKKAHEQAVQKVEFLENKDLVEKFCTLSEQLRALNYNNGTFAVLVPTRERDLIVEGKLLNHCVGGYGSAHCEGRSIFFIRQSKDLKIPYYTLQVDLKTGKQLQLHGYNNDRDKPIPQEVKDFVCFWLNNIFRRFDVEKMKFIDKPKAAATA